MAYTQENFQEWIFFISDKMEYFTGEFAKEHNLTLNYSIKSLDDLEKWILSNFKHYNDLIAKKELLDYLTIYIGETFRKHIGGKWFIDLKNKKNAYYSMPVLTDETYIGETFVAPMTFATACISRNKGNYISTILLNCMEDMGIQLDSKVK
ncbi:hypothetical protein [Prevotella pallens]|jgi:hypothetical protein|uniref:hypothetical protein n=2 Tax=Prevotella pallens TaxID=60133 RepID=UPI001CB1C7DA|nr:hypothetical protein [Prevotella pallens]MBF1487371.1 hypothetical protein [Prevotella pallens]